jgi:hypothetical protein
LVANSTTALEAVETGAANTSLAGEATDSLNGTAIATDSLNGTAIATDALGNATATSDVGASTVTVVRFFFLAQKQDLVLSSARLSP